MATKAGSKAASKTVSKAGSKDDKGEALPLQVAHRIEVLLHTMRVIERHEEQLCVVMTEIRSEGAVSAATRKELQALLEELPSDAYQTDLEAVGAALARVTPSAGDRGRGAGAKKAKSRPK